MTSVAGIVIIVGGLIAGFILVWVLVAAQRRHPEGFGGYAGKAGSRRQVAEEFYDPAADPDYQGEALPTVTDSTLRGDLALPDAPKSTPPPAKDSE